MSVISLIVLLILTQQVILNSTTEETEFEKDEWNFEIFSPLKPILVYLSKLNYHKRLLKVENFSQWTKEKLRKLQKKLFKTRNELGKVKEVVQEIKTQVTQMVDKIQNLEEKQQQFETNTENNFRTVRLALASANNKVQELEMSTSQLNKTRVPVGFIYFQLFDQPKPEEIWLEYKWEDVSKKYAGLFFRVVGGTAALFGQMQNSTCPRIIRVMSKEDKENGAKDALLKIGQWSAFVQTGQGENTSSSSVKTRFLTSNDEVTPKNQAIKIWRRID